MKWCHKKILTEQLWKYCWAMLGNFMEISGRSWRIKIFPVRSLVSMSRDGTEGGNRRKSVGNRRHFEKCRNPWQIPMCYVVIRCVFNININARIWPWYAWKCSYRKCQHPFHVGIRFPDMNIQVVSVAKLRRKYRPCDRYRRRSLSGQEGFAADNPFRQYSDASSG